ncbi:MAG: exodeoxyribonuclease VII small subunit [Rikenellaceae bacterium]
MAEELSYRAAIAEVEQIVRAMQDSNVDVDKLAAMVTRASELIAQCNAKLKKAQEEVEKVVENNN